MIDDTQKRMGCPVCHGTAIYDPKQDRLFCMDCGFDSKSDRPNVTLGSETTPFGRQDS